MIESLLRAANKRQPGLQVSIRDEPTLASITLIVMPARTAAAMLLSTFYTASAALLCEAVIAAATPTRAGSPQDATLEARGHPLFKSPSCTYRIECPERVVQDVILYQKCMAQGECDGYQYIATCAEKWKPKCADCKCFKSNEWYWEPTETTAKYMGLVYQIPHPEARTDD